MSQPRIGEVISAKYRGTCTRSGQNYLPGAKIARDEFGYYLADQPDQGGTISLGGGSGYGCDGWQVGDVVWHEPWNQLTKQRDPGIPVVITRAKARYYGSDGLSFGVGDDRGYLYEARAREATPEEAAPLLARREAQRAASAKEQALRTGLKTLFNSQYSPDHDTPPGDHPLFKGRRLKIGEGFTLYGGGEELHVDADGQHVWHLRNNGADGDFWGANNVPTGGAGAIGTRFPLTQDRTEFLDEHFPDWRNSTATTVDTDGDLETL